MGQEGGVDYLPVVVIKVDGELWVFVCDNGGVLCWLNCEFLFFDELGQARREGWRVVEDVVCE